MSVCVRGCVCMSVCVRLQVLYTCVCVESRKKQFHDTHTVKEIRILCKETKVCLCV